MHQNIITNPVQLRLQTFGFMEQNLWQNFCINLKKFVCRQIPPQLIKRADTQPAPLKAKSSRLRWWMEVKAVPTVLLQEHTLSPNRPSILCDVDTWALRLLACLLQTPRHLYLITHLNWPPDRTNTLTSTCKHTHEPKQVKPLNTSPEHNASTLCGHILSSYCGRSVLCIQQIHFT